MKCKNCNSEIDKTVDSCPECGAKVIPQKKKKPFWLLFIIIPVVILLLVGILLVGILAIGGIGLIIFGDNIADSLPFSGNNTVSAQSVLQSDSALTPDCVGIEYEQALDLLDDAGYTRITASYEYSDDVPANCVISQSVDYSSAVPENGEIELVVSYGPDVSPTGYKQLIRVTAPKGSSKALLTLCNWENGKWREIFSCEAVVGKNGIGPNYGEGNNYTPEGEFAIGYGLIGSPYLGENPFVFEVVTEDTCIVDDVDSPAYNTLQNISELPRGTHYDPLGKTIISGHTWACIFIEHNGNGREIYGAVSGKGSAITICGVKKMPSSTAGCIDISVADMQTLVSLMNDDLDPHIEIYTK